MELKRTDIILKPNNARVLFRPSVQADRSRATRIVARVMALSDVEVDRLLEAVLSEFHGRHQKLKQFFITRFQHLQEFMLTDAPVSEPRQMLLGAYFTQEYALESAALFNPSMVWHPDQTGQSPFELLRADTLTLLHQSITTALSCPLIVTCTAPCRAV